MELVNGTCMAAGYNVALEPSGREGARCEVQYLGKVEWVGATTLRLVPKDPSIAPIEVGLDG